MSSISSCVHPLKSFLVGFHDGKKGDIKETRKITGYSVKELVRSDGRIIPVFEDKPFLGHIEERFTEYDEIPCGHCLACRLRNSRQWADRMACEAITSPPAYFWTLTYDNSHLPLNSYFNPDTGECLEAVSLDKIFFQKWIKRLRKHFEPKKVRFFACGEYGDKKHRPHYHMITFGLSLENLLLVKQSHLGYNLYTSPELLDLWSDPVTHENLGFVLVSPANWQTMAYVSRYVTKKLGKTREVNQLYTDRGEIPEFALMSRKPGIGHDYFEQHKSDIYDFDAFYLRVGDQSKKVYVPHYFDYLKEIEDASFIKLRKEAIREKVLEKKKQMLSQTDRAYLDILSDDEVILTERINKLKRGLD